MKCQLKPIVLEAFRWTGGFDQTEDPEWMVEALEKDDAWIEQGNPPRMFIRTEEGIVRAEPGEYIMNSSVSGIYPISQTKFNELYEVVEE